MDEVVVGGETISTAAVAPQEAFDMWEAVISDGMTSCSMQPISAGPFHAALTPLVYSDPIALATARNAAELARRTARHIARSDRSSVVAVMPLVGGCEVEIDRQRLSAPAGSMYIIDDDHPQLLQTDGFTALMVRADRDLVLAASGLGADRFPTAVVLDPGGPGALVLDFFHRLAAGPIPEPAAPALLRAGIELLGAGMALGSGGRPSEPAALTVEHERVMAFVNHHLTDPELDVETIARGCGMSRRRVHRLLAEPWGGPMKLVRQLRIQRARALLVDHPDQTVASIAHACGFGGDRNFFRVFRAETGMSPAEFRERALAAERSGTG
ncbi:AraC family transcriptional regulator [Nocardia cyriacigeorgica]|uniref:AraC family transcriptional regulator n=1 Tax=Nocardia cyriacigeorgica TaxID=135487 RepID=UPI00248FF916|nr:AraC family transcriptional regulator [Nocardia cyriacigeorgica]BDT87499.1 hypothetical protein FMUAM8_32630 [Nocardia cyriacigeorgica]